MARVIFDGPFSQAQLVELIALVRGYDEQSDGSGTYHVVVFDADASVEEMEKTARASVPEKPGRTTEIRTHRFGVAEVDDK